MRQRLRGTITAILAIAAACQVAPVKAASLTERSALSFAGPQNSYDFPALRGFDTSLGTLTSATLTMGGTVDIEFTQQFVFLLARPLLSFGGFPVPFGSTVTFQEAPLGGSTITGGGQTSQLQDGPNAVTVNLQGTVDDLGAVSGPDVAPTLDIFAGFNDVVLDGLLEADLTFTYDAAAANGTQVPEPTSIALLAAGLLSFGLWRRQAL